MKSIILCEGSTDCILLQYFMRKMYGWETEKTGERSNSMHFKFIRTMKKEDDILRIGSCGGSGKVLQGFDYIMDYNMLSAEFESYDKVVIISDRDEIKTEEMFLNGVATILSDRSIKVKDDICNNKWRECLFKNGHGKECKVQLLILLIPFEKTGALETFLLDAISKKDSYDAQIIEECNRFVDKIDSEKRYLTKRRYITKAKFDVYFSIRTVAEQFVERRDILKNIEWEKYLQIQSDFGKLGDLSS